MSLVWNRQVTSAKAWRGDALSKDTSWIVRLTDAEIAEIDRAVGVAKPTGLPVEQIQREHLIPGLREIGGEALPLAQRAAHAVHEHDRPALAAADKVGFSEKGFHDRAIIPISAGAEEPRAAGARPAHPY